MLATGNDSLSVRLWSDGLSFAIGQNGKAAVSNRVAVGSAADLPRALEEELGAAHLIDKPCGSVVVQLGAATLVPQRLYRPADARAWLAPVSELASTDTCRADLIERYGCFNVYSLPAAVEAFVNARWPQARLTDSLTELILSMDSRGGQCISASMSHRMLNVAVADGSTLRLANRLPVPTPDDAAYALLNIYKQLSLRPAEVPLTLVHTDLLPADGLRRLLEPYLKLGIRN